MPKLPTTFIGVRAEGKGEEPEGAATPRIGQNQTVIFGQTLGLHFSGRSQQPKMKKILSVRRDEVPEIRDFYLLLMGGVSRAKQLCRLELAVSFGAVLLRNFPGKGGLSP